MEFATLAETAALAATAVLTILAGRVYELLRRAERAAADEPRVVGAPK